MKGENKKYNLLMDTLKTFRKKKEVQMTQKTMTVYIRVLGSTSRSEGAFLFRNHSLEATEVLSKNKGELQA